MAAPLPPTPWSFVWCRDRGTTSQIARVYRRNAGLGSGVLPWSSTARFVIRGISRAIIFRFILRWLRVVPVAAVVESVIRKLGLVVCALSIASCSTELTSEAMLVRQISTDASAKCSFLGPVSGSEAFGIDVAGDAESAFNKVRNEVAARGGNAFVLTQSTSTDEATNVQADAYICR